MELYYLQKHNMIILINLEIVFIPKMVVNGTLGKISIINLE
jgi:hypothetical protein